MIEINLLPQQLRRKKTITLPQVPAKKMVIVVLGSLVLFHLLLGSLTAINRKRLSALERTWRGLSSKRKQLGQLNKQLNEINTKIPLIEQLIRERILWSRKLNELSNIIVNGVWLNGLSLKKECLIIRGSCASRTKDEPALIGRFMQSLKDDSSFSSDFAEIELGPIKKRLIKQTEIMDFDLSCRFKGETDAKD